MSAPSSYEVAARRLLAEGGVRYDQGVEFSLPSGPRFVVESGWVVVLRSRFVGPGRVVELPRATPDPSAPRR